MQHRPDGRDEEGYPEILKALEEGLRMFALYSWRIENSNADLTLKMSLGNLASMGICDKKM
jgi:hypothetical protein